MSRQDETRTTYLNKEEAQADWEAWFYSEAPEPIPVCCDCKTRPIDFRIKGYDLCTECLVPAIEQNMREETNPKYFDRYFADWMLVTGRSI